MESTQSGARLPKYQIQQNCVRSMLIAILGWIKPWSYHIRIT
jgi:hypothetical protein